MSRDRLDFLSWVSEPTCFNSAQPPFGRARRSDNPLGARYDYPRGRSSAKPRARKTLPSSEKFDPGAGSPGPVRTDPPRLGSRDKGVFSISKEGLSWCPVD